jgi:hypothetical protein
MNPTLKLAARGLLALVGAASLSLAIGCEGKSEPAKPAETTTAAPKTEAPKTEAPKTEAPKTEAPKTENKPEAPKTEAPKAEPPKAAAPSAGKKSYVIGVIAKSQSNPVFQAARTGAEDAAHDLSAKYGIDVKINWRTPNDEDAQKQAQFVEQLVSSGANGIAVSCTDAKILTSAINSAVDQGRPGCHLRL